MKNLSAIPRLSLPETFTILITLVVCLAGFTEAEVKVNYKDQTEGDTYPMQENFFKENLPHSQYMTKLTMDETEGRNYQGYNNDPDSLPDELVRKRSDEIGESGDLDKENDGYGYDEDEYYHFNFKRSDNEMENKMATVKVHDFNQKMAHSNKDKNKEIETIEMLSFKESHPSTGTNEDQNIMDNTKSYSNEMNRKKLPAYPANNQLKRNNVRENLIEKEKNGANEMSSTDMTLTENKNEGQTSEEKNTGKIKDTQVAEDSEKKEPNLKDDEETVAEKPTKDSAEGKEKDVKLNENAKLEDTFDKLSRTKEESSKVAGDDSKKASSDMINPSELPKLRNRGGFVSSEGKDNQNTAKAETNDDEERMEPNRVETNNMLRSCLKENVKRNQNSMKNLYPRNEVDQGSAGDTNKFGSSGVFEYPNQPASDYFQKREWKDQSQGIKFHMMSQLPLAQRYQLDKSQEQLTFTQDQQNQAQQMAVPQHESHIGQADSEVTLDPRFKSPYGLNIPAKDLENTEYHRNFIKSLKRYKGMASEDQRNLPDPSNQSSDKAIFIDRDKDYNMEILEQMKRRSAQSGETETSESKHSKLRRNGHASENSFSDSRTHARDSQNPQLLSKTHADDPKLKEQSDSNRARRKSQKLEYEIQVKYCNPQVEKNDKLATESRRIEKDIKTKLTAEEKYSKKYPYSQVSMDDLTKIENSNVDRKVKRKAPVWKRHDQKSVIQTRAAPSGYYSNRVKFGQKNYAKSNERSSPEMSSIMLGQLPWPSLDSHSSAAVDKNKMLRSWNVRQQNFKHDPIKRFDENGSPNKGNSLLLVRKTDRVATSFEEGTPQNSNDLTPDTLSKMLSENDYDVKKPEQKMSESNLSAQSSSYLASYPNAARDEGNQQISQLDTQTFKNKGLFARSSHLDKDDKKYSSKSNLKKTFDKFRDLAGFFKDNEQESADNQYQAQELKEGRDIVFSEDKLPDPIVINSDGSEKSQTFNQKPLNSIYSISTNFKTLDQQDKKSEVPGGAESEKNMLTAEVKAEPSESSWEPALRTIFPEARTINSIAKNGNEIIVLDLNRTPLKTSHAFNNAAKTPAKAQQQFGTFGFTSQVPVNNPLAGKKGSFAISPSYQMGTATKSPQKGLNSQDLQGQRHSVLQIADNLPSLLKSVIEVEPTATKTLTKRSPERPLQSRNYEKFVEELNELAELNKKTKFYRKRNANSDDSFSEAPNYNPPGMKTLEHLMQNILSDKNPTVDDTWHKAEVTEEKPQKYRNQKLVGVNGDSPFENKVENKLEKSDERSYQDEFWQELMTTPDKINRLRREGAEKRQNRKTVEDSLKEKSGKESSGSVVEEKCGKLNSEPTCAKEPSLSSQHDYVKMKESSMGKNAEYENHISDLSESQNKNQRDRLILPNDSTSKRKKRKENHRRKRSPDLHNENKVSTTAVHNTILKNLAEDNYQSVYSPGIKRRLFSTNNEADEDEYFTDAYEHDKDLMAEEPRDKCVKNSFNKCIDPMILELFEGADVSDEKIRARRSLSTQSHRNFKREIDLDESMPNDFQNFLVTSLGSQKELIKKEDGLPYTENFLVGGSSEAVEDSALEKRDVSSSETRKKQKYKKEFYPEENGSNRNSESLKTPLHEAEKHVRSDEKSKTKGTSEYTDEKLPTQIRIQITNASTKEKKASKPIMEESETTATETETPPKDKEFFDKNKASTARVNNLSKIHGQPKSKFTYDYDDNQDSTQSPYQQNRRRRKKKKYVPESPTKVTKDMVKFDQKAMESLLRKVMTDQAWSSDQSVQKLPSGVNNHLPQVETVYNPTQDSNKAQLDVMGYGETGEKSTASSKTDLRSFDEGSVRDLFKDKDKIKLEKSKEYEEGDWNTQDKMKVRQDLNWELPSIKTAISDATDPSNSYLASLEQRPYGQKNNPPTSSYFFHPSVSNGLTASNLYNALKLKQEVKSHNGILNDRQSGRLFRKPLHYTDASYLRTGDKTQNPILSAATPWSFDFSPSKKSAFRSYKNRDLFGMKNRNQLDGKSKLLHGSRRKLVNFYEAKSPMIDAPSPYSMMDSTKDLDYFSGSDEDYLEELEAMKDPQNDDIFSMASYRKTGKFGETPSFHYLYKYRNPEVDDNVNEDDEEIEEDYDESNEDEDFEDYSLLAGARDHDQLRNGHGRNKFQSSFSTSSNFFKYNLPKGHTMYQSEFFSPLSDSKFTQGRHYPLEDLKDPLTSTSLLKKSNEKSGILENNILKNSLAYNIDYGDIGRTLDKAKGLHGYSYKNLMKRQYGKKKRSRDKPQPIGSRMFIARRTEVEDNPPFNYEVPIKSKIRHTPYRRNPLNAEFADPDNFENEAEENKFNGNLMNWRQEENKVEQQDMKEEREEGEDGVGDVAENLEDTSENNVLENVIGRYIMRKRVATPIDVDSSSNKEENEEKHKLKKRSLESRSYDEDPPEVKLVSKRLSSGHLTENNFRKYHKKNLTGKRQTTDSDFNIYGTMADCNPAVRNSQKREKTQMKRSALDLFKKITKQDRDYKKAESADCRTAGFEPLSSVNDKKYEGTIQNIKTDLKIQTPRLSPSESTQIGDAQLKPYSPSDVLVPDQRKKEKSKMSPTENSSGSSQGPWKIDLDNINVGKAKNVDVTGKGVGQENLKAFLLIHTGATTDERSAAILPPFTSGSFQKEVGTSYRPKSVEGRGISKRHVRKRSLDSPLVRTAISDGEATQLAKEQKTHVKLEEQNRALHDSKSLSEGDSILQPPHVLQRNTKTIRSFVNAVEQSQNARLPSTGRLNKRKSVFPPSNHANIMRDGRHVNEETSKYLGEQIVDAILTHVSANPKFKELIAPGLASRTTVYKEDVDVKQRPLHQADISEQLQFFLQKFMLDLEKLAEKHVRKRMCNEIDQQSRKFLQSLLGVPLNAGNNKKSINQKLCTCPEESEDPDYLDEPRNAELLESDTEEPRVETQEREGQEQADTLQQKPNTQEQKTVQQVATQQQEAVQQQMAAQKQAEAQQKEAAQQKVVQQQMQQQASQEINKTGEALWKAQQDEIEDLKRKHNLLLKLIDDYKMLSDYEKNRIRVEYDKVSQKLDEIRSKLKALNATSSDVCGYKNSFSKNSPDYEAQSQTKTDSSKCTNWNKCPNYNRVPKPPNQGGNQPNSDSEQTPTQFSCPDPSQCTNYNQPQQSRQQGGNQPNPGSEEPPMQYSTCTCSSKCPNCNKVPQPPKQGGSQPNLDSKEPATQYSTCGDSNKCTQCKKPKPPKQGGSEKNQKQKGSQQNQQTPKTEVDQQMPINKTNGGPFEEVLWKMGNPQGPPILLLKDELAQKKHKEKQISSSLENKEDRSNKINPQCLPTMFFDENYKKNAEVLRGSQEPQKDAEFENVVNENLQYPTQGKVKNTTTISEEESLTRTFDSSPLPVQTFDLLPCQNSSDDDDAQEPAESALDMETLSEPDTSENSEDEEENSVDNDIHHQEELNKLSLGDAAGLQLSLKHRSPWVSNLDIGKMEPIQQMEERLKSSVNPPPVKNVQAYDPVLKSKRARSICCGSYKPWWKHGFTHHHWKPELFVSRKSPFQSVSKSYYSLKEDKIPASYFLSKVSASGKKRIFLRSSPGPRPKRLSAKSSKQRSLPGGKISPLSHPTTRFFQFGKPTKKLNILKLEGGDTWSSVPTVQHHLEKEGKGFRFNEFLSKNSIRKRKT